MTLFAKLDNRKNRSSSTLQDELDLDHLC